MKAANLFIENGLESDLHTLEEKALDLCTAVIKYIDIHHKFPAITDESPYVRKLANWLTSMRASHNNKSKRLIYPSITKMVNDSKYPDLFNRIKTRDESKITRNSTEYHLHRVRQSLDKFNELLAFTDVHGRYPFRITKDRIHSFPKDFCDTSNRLFHWMSSMRRANYGKGTRVLYPVLIKAVKESNYPNIFNSNWKDDFK